MDDIGLSCGAIRRAMRSGQATPSKCGDVGAGILGVVEGIEFHRPIEAPASWVGGPSWRPGGGGCQRRIGDPSHGV
jgi:hypothetical protein